MTARTQVRPVRALLALCVAGTLGTGCAQGGAARAPAAPAAAAAPSRVPGEYLVTLAPGTDPRAILGALAEAGVTSIRSVGADLYVVTVRDDPGPERMKVLRANDPRIRAVQPNFLYRSTR